MSRKSGHVYVIYTHFPFYRAPVFDALSDVKRFRFSFFYDPAGVDSTILSGKRDASNYRPIRTDLIGPFYWQTSAVRLALCSPATTLVFLGNPYILSTWLAIPLARLRGRSVLIWGHGWLARETGLKRVIRNLFYRLADGLLVYGHRARDIGVDQGFSSDRIFVIGNSLDYERQKAARSYYLQSKEEVGSIKSAKPYFLIVSRLVESARIDMAISALGRLNQNISLVIIGEGPARKMLEALAADLGVDAHFTGALYSEEELAPWFIDCIAVVAPGKVGLLAMHALAYGAPVITHGFLDKQMPEVEAIRPGVTGAFFKYGSTADLARQMGAYVSEPLSAAEKTRRSAIAIETIEDRYTPKRQAELITQALVAMDCDQHD